MFDTTPLMDEVFVERDRQWQELLQSLQQTDCTVTQAEHYCHKFWKTLERVDEDARFALSHQVEETTRLWMRTGNPVYLSRLQELSSLYCTMGGAI